MFSCLSLETVTVGLHLFWVNGDEQVYKIDGMTLRETLCRVALADTSIGSTSTQIEGRYE